MLFGVLPRSELFTDCPLLGGPWEGDVGSAGARGPEKSTDTE